jgi:hypothetical protein
MLGVYVFLMVASKKTLAKRSFCFTEKLSGFHNFFKFVGSTAYRLRLI